MDKPKSEIPGMRHDIDSARTQKMREMMAEYDATVYYPAKQILYTLCDTQGHGIVEIHDNGFGWIFSHCTLCGAKVSSSYLNPFEGVP